MTGLAGLCLATLLAAFAAFATMLVLERRRGATDVSATRLELADTADSAEAARPADVRPRTDVAPWFDSSCVDPALRRVLAVEVLAPPVTPRYLPVVLRYDLIDPYAVRAEFKLPGSSTSWVFARDLLARGLRGPSGDGDVRIWPVDGDGLRLTLLSPDGEALIQADASGVHEFLRQTYALCPEGREGDHVDVDAVLRSMLAS